MFGVGAALFLPGAGVDPILPESVPGPWTSRAGVPAQQHTDYMWLS